MVHGGVSKQAGDTIDLLVIVFSDIKRGQNPQFTQTFQNAKKGSEQVGPEALWQRVSLQGEQSGTYCVGVGV